ncbi:hypothetical protein ACFYYM_31200 [Streptomyces erythrochromogenes]|uniref:hypothetical protein n=1 Tax=Streptomyces erythrochromogenes TaxID=285574 RepID=UPI0036A215DF
MDEPRKTGRRWGPTRGTSAELNNLAILLRGWLDVSGVRISGLQSQLTSEHFHDLDKVPSTSTISEWLSGIALRWDFVEAVIDICSTNAEIAMSRRGEARSIWNAAEKSKRDRQNSNPRPEAVHPLSQDQLLSWLAKAPAVPPAERASDISVRSAAQRISDLVSEETVAGLVEGLLDNLHPRTWEILVKELREQGKSLHAVQLMQDLGSRGDPHKIIPVVEFLRTDGHFGDDRILLDSIAKNRTVQDLVTIIEAFRRDGQNLSAYVVTERIGVVRSTSSTVEIILDFKDKKETEALAGILMGAGKWRDGQALAELINQLRVQGIGECADLILMAAGSERAASSFPPLVNAIKDTCATGDIVKLAHAIGYMRSRPRLKPLEDTLWKTNHTDMLSLIRIFGSGRSSGDN